MSDWICYRSTVLRTLAGVSDTVESNASTDLGEVGLRVLLETAVLRDPHFLRLRRGLAQPSPLPGHPTRIGRISYSCEASGR
jgi:hypothetical protein